MFAFELTSPMINYKRYVLNNGLRLIINEDPSTPLVALNLLYNVGSRDERPERTGLAHLLEHLMFNGSVQVHDYDSILQLAGGDSNAITSADTTNFYSVVPLENIETVLWMEADRMRNLLLDHQSLEIQRNIVLEEFKETCLNQPYGDSWHQLSQMAYKVHPYQWPTIGKKPEHLEEVTLSDIRSFYDSYYYPNNAILSISGSINADFAYELVEKWFGQIVAGPLIQRVIPAEPSQIESQQLEKKADVPVDAIFMAFHMTDRCHPDYYGTDLISDVLSSGRSSRLYSKLVKQQRIFNSIDAYVSGSIDPGLFIVEGRPSGEVSVQDSIDAIWNEIDLLKTEVIPHDELTKVKNKVETNLIASECSILGKALNLSFFELLGNAELINSEKEIYNLVSAETIMAMANKYLTRQNCSLLVYKASGK